MGEALALIDPEAGIRPAPLLLLIDDDPSVGRFIAHAAEECGYRALSTMTADSFRREYRLLDPDVVALDLGMPGSDGIELLRFLAEEKCTVPIIIISGFDRRVLESSSRLGEALGLTMAGPLEKPMRLHDLEALLEGLELRSGI
jgi:DNA-binding response OmpR family regulator